jgi:hypothetical protein
VKPGDILTSRVPARDQARRLKGRNTMNLDFRSEIAVAAARAFADGARGGQTGVQCGSARLVAARPADQTTVAGIIATIVTQTTKELAAAG